MKPTKASGFSLTAVAILLCATAIFAHAQSEGILHSFAGGTSDGASPYAGLIADSSGNLYGTAAYRGANDDGIVYKLTPPSAGGTWTESILYEFAGGSDGAVPASNLIMDASGAIYGTNTGGGTYNCGVFFKLTPPTSGGSWTETSLYQFPCAVNGYESDPINIVLNQTTGVFYGVTQYGGPYYGGYVYELAPATGGRWTFTTLHNFNSSPGAPGYINGCAPWTLISTNNGDLYGTAVYCGQGNRGTVYRLTPPTSGINWNFKVLYAFGSSSTTDGSSPYGLVFDKNGVLYGGTGGGGSASEGTIYSLTPNNTGQPWTEAILHNFAASGDGNLPASGVILGPGGALFGTTAGGGSSEANCGFYNGCGTVFELTDSSSGWTETILDEFSSTGGDAINPNPGPLVERGGNLYGASYNGGADSLGAVYAIHP